MDGVKELCLGGGTMFGGGQTSPCLSRSQARTKVSIWCQAAVKILWQNPTMTDNQMLSASARMSPVSDPQQSRLTAVGKRQGLPQDNQRLRLKKLADGKTSKIRILTLNVGSMTGRGREIAAVLKERKIDIAGARRSS